MFKKPVKVKSNNQVKASDRKNIRELFSTHFSSLTEEQTNDLFSKKEVLSCLKLTTHSDEIVQVYTIQKVPMFFMVKDDIFPTIFLLWKYPDLVYTYTTHSQVAQYLYGGADLMLPGVLTPPSDTGLPKYGRIKEGSIVAVNLSSNKAAIAVGTAFQSSDAMISSNGRGKCVTVVHFYGDKLCSVEGMLQIPVPNLGSTEWQVLKSYDEDFPTLASKRIVNRNEKRFDEVKKEEVLDVEDNRKSIEPSIEPEAEESNLITGEIVEEKLDMDELVHYCFLAAIKYSKTLTFPLLLSNFFKLHMLPMCPEGHMLDLKLSSYKKLKPFLDQMQKDGLIAVKEIKKGVEAITAINKDHPKFCEFYVSPGNRHRENQENNSISVKQTEVMESYGITQNVLPIFEGCGYRKGDILQGPTIRRLVTEYVKQNNFQDDNNSRLIRPRNEVLQKICKTENPIAWEELFEKVCESMKNCFKVTSGNEQILNKGKAAPINMVVKMRSGNKKVTLVDNLELYGINMNEFAKECQHGVAASTSITPKTAGQKSDQLLVQGNQVVFIYNSLVEKYKIPKKYVKGLENAPKKKK